MHAKLLIPILLVFAVAISGCTAPSGTGNLVLQITDQPNLSIEMAEVTISKIQVHTAPATSNESSEPSSGWITITEEPQTFDLVAIKDVKDFLGEKELAPGIYTQIRLDVESALVIIDGVQYNLTIPSKTVKIVRSFQMIENQTTTLTLDFNAEQSVQKAGDKYIMRPTIQIIQEEKKERKKCTRRFGKEREKKGDDGDNQVKVFSSF